MKFTNPYLVIPAGMARIQVPGMALPSAYRRRRNGEQRRFPSYSICTMRISWSVTWLGTGYAILRCRIMWTGSSMIGESQRAKRRLATCPRQGEAHFVMHCDIRNKGISAVLAGEPGRPQVLYRLRRTAPGDERKQGAVSRSYECPQRDNLIRVNQPQEENRKDDCGPSRLSVR